MRFSSRRVVNFAVAGLSMALLLGGFGGPAMSQTAPPAGATTSLPNVVVEAPKHTARPQPPKPQAVDRGTVSARISPPSPSPSAQPVKLANATSGSCAGGCVTSFRTGDAPWRGCSVSGVTFSSTCRNVGNYKTYIECTEAGLATGWRGTEVAWYCGSLALK